jgi:hypothetical protein
VAACLGRDPLPACRHRGGWRNGHRPRRIQAEGPHHRGAADCAARRPAFVSSVLPDTRAPSPRTYPLQTLIVGRAWPLRSRHRGRVREAGSERRPEQRQSPVPGAWGTIPRLRRPIAAGCGSLALLCTPGGEGPSHYRRPWAGADARRAKPDRRPSSPKRIAGGPWGRWPK